MRFLLFFLLIKCCIAQDLVPWFDNTNYTRTESISSPWYIANNRNPSKLYLNGVYQSQETGTNDLNMKAVWAIQTKGCKAGLVDMTTHGKRAKSLITSISNSDIYYHEISRWDANLIGNGIVACITNNCRIITVTYGFVASFPTLSNACYLANLSNVIICCSVPNQEGNLDGALIDYPYNYRLSNVLGVSSTDRNGNHYNPSATGTNCIAAPGRNIVADADGWTYATGTSWACPIVAGCMALLIERFPGQTHQAYITAVKQSAINNRINPLNMLLIPLPTLSITKDNITVHGLQYWQYEIQRQKGLYTPWEVIGVTKSNDSIPASEGIFRARVL